MFKGRTQIQILVLVTRLLRAIKLFCELAENTGSRWDFLCFIIPYISDDTVHCHSHSTDRKLGPHEHCYMGNMENSERTLEGL